MMNLFKTIAAAACSAMLASSAGAATLQNGSFEDIGSGTLNGRGWNIFDSVPGWTGAPNIEIQSNKTLGSIDAQDGTRYAELDTNTNTVISQDVFLTAGSYELSFWYSPRVNRAQTSTNDMFYGVAAGSIDYIYEEIEGAPNPTYAHGSWTNVLASFTLAADQNVTLSFGALGEQRTSGCGDCGALIDNISISAVPLPAGLMLMLTGLGALGIARRRKSA